MNWWHSIHLGNNVVTPGRDRTARKLKTLGIPEDLSGKSVLDIGAWDGFFSFEAERRGASRVLAIDKPAWCHSDFGKAGFELAREALGSRVEDRQMAVEELVPEAVGEFDLVLFLGVLYHVKNPLLVLERVASVTRNQLILETATDMLGIRRPAAAFYPGDELSKDESNWWAPNLSAGEAMLRAVGFSKVHVYYASSLPNRIARSAHKSLLGLGEFRPSFRQGRAVFHAFR